MKKIFVMDFHGTIVRGYDFEFSFFSQMFIEQDSRKKLDMFLKLLKMYSKKKKDDIQAIYDVMEMCLNSLDLKEDEVNHYIDNIQNKSCVLYRGIPKDVDLALRNLKNVYVVTRGVENIIKKVLEDYNLKIYGNELYYDGKWKIRRNIISAEDKLFRMNRIFRESGECKVFVVGNDRNDIKILEAGFPIGAYSAERHIKDFVESRHGLILKKGNFDELLRL